MLCNIFHDRYGFQGNLTTSASQLGCQQGDIEDIDNAFSKIAAKGVTILFASGDSGSGYNPMPDPDGQCGPAHNKKDTALNGTVMQTIDMPDADMCCNIAAMQGQGWEFGKKKVTPYPKCYGSKTPGELTDKMLEGERLEKLKVESAEECCDKGKEDDEIAGWSYYKESYEDADGKLYKEGECTLFMEVTGSYYKKGANSHKGGGPDNEGACKIFSKVTGHHTVKGKTSGTMSNGANVKLYASWPASSPWVTAVGATRFVDARTTTGEEMATDQFGSGGGFSWHQAAPKIEAAPVANYLKVAPQLPPKGSFSPTGRATPDVAALGEGFQVVVNGDTMTVGGTSASTPTFAGIVSLLNEARVQKKMKPMGLLNPFLYQNTAAFNDARQDSAEDFCRLGALLFTATAWIFIPPAYCFAVP